MARIGLTIGSIRRVPILLCDPDDVRRRVTTFTVPARYTQITSATPICIRSYHSLADMTPEQTQAIIPTWTALPSDQISPEIFRNLN
jgi:hypothetical protein